MRRVSSVRKVLVWINGTDVDIGRGARSSENKAQALFEEIETPPSRPTGVTSDIDKVGRFSITL